MAADVQPEYGDKGVAGEAFIFNGVIPPRGLNRFDARSDDAPSMLVSIDEVLSLSGRAPKDGWLCERFRLAAAVPLG